jgi:hypothetical protein
MCGCFDDGRVRVVVGEEVEEGEEGMLLLTAMRYCASLSSSSSSRNLCLL